MQVIIIHLCLMGTWLLYLPAGITGKKEDKELRKVAQKVLNTITDLKFKQQHAVATCNPSSPEAQLPENRAAILQMFDGKNTNDLGKVIQEVAAKHNEALDKLIPEVKKLRAELDKAGPSANLTEYIRKTAKWAEYAESFPAFVLSVQPTDTGETIRGKLVELMPKHPCSLDGVQRRGISALVQSVKNKCNWRKGWASALACYGIVAIAFALGVSGILYSTGVLFDYFRAQPSPVVQLFENISYDVYGTPLAERGGSKVWLYVGLATIAVCLVALFVFYVLGSEEDEEDELDDEDDEGGSSVSKKKQPTGKSKNNKSVKPVKGGKSALSARKSARKSTKSAKKSAKSAAPGKSRRVKSPPKAQPAKAQNP